MVTSTLLNHRGGRDVAREELAVVPCPPPTDSWFPIPHFQVLDAVSETLQGAGFQIGTTRLSLSHGDARFFGTLDLTHRVSDVNGGVTLAVGIRNSVDKSFPIGFCCGTRVFVCDNLAFTSEIIVSKKHTRFGQERYLEGIGQAVSGLHQYQEAAANWIDRLQTWDLTEDAANSYLLQAYEADIIGARLLPLVLKEWRYRDSESGEWRDSNSFRPGDLPALIFALQKAQEYSYTKPLSDESENPDDETRF